MTFTEVRHWPIVKQYAKRLNLVEIINRLVDTQMELSPGMAILAMVIDTLSGRTPLYRLTEFFSNLVGQQDDWPAAELLKLYKSQIGIEKNFNVNT
jgi:hypothetical protein